MSRERVEKTSGKGAQVKRHISLLVGLVLALATLVAVLLVMRKSPAPCPVDVGPASFDKLKIGMSESEIEAILGGPAGDYRTRAGVWYMFVGPGLYSKDDPVPITKEWDTDSYAICVNFGPEGKAIRIMGAGAHEDSFIDRIPMPLMLRRLIPVP
jgi:hypothetical protein